MKVYKNLKDFFDFIFKFVNFFGAQKIQYRKFPNFLGAPASINGFL